MKEQEYICPICGAKLAWCLGSKLDANDGITMWCPNHNCQSPDGIPCQEVMGHGDNDKQAFEVIKQKYHKD
jgi:hypothetical protein